LRQTKKPSPQYDNTHGTKAEAPAIPPILRHTSICVPYNGGKPSQPTCRPIFGALLGSDFRL